MTTFELEVAAYAAAHRIYNGLPAPDRPCPGGYRSRMIDQIAEEIKGAFSIHNLASAKSGPSPETESVRHSKEEYTLGKWWTDMSADQQRQTCRDISEIGQLLSANDPEGIPAGLQQTQHWRELRHAFDSGVADYWRELRHAFDMGGGSGTQDRPCLKCGMPDRFTMHFSPSGAPLQPAHVEPTPPSEAQNPGEAKP